jgi:hypothetical protein
LELCTTAIQFISAIYLSGKDDSKAVLWDFKVSDGRKSEQWARIKVLSNWDMEGFGTFNYGHDHRESDRGWVKKLDTT